MIYRIHQPRVPRIRSCVELIWYISQDASEVATVAPRMIPDGHYHLVIDLGDPHSYTDSKGRVVRARRTHINAHQAEYVDIARSGRVEMMGVMFRPLGFAALVQQPVDVIAGGVRNMDELLRPSCVSELEEVLFASNTIEGRFIRLEAWLAARLEPGSVVRSEIEAAVQLLSGRHGLAPVRQVAEQVQLSERTLERAFKAGMGMTPKQFADIRRMQFVLRQMGRRDEQMLHYALQAGFYDQAHFIHRFKRMVGMTPSDYVRERNLLSDLYNTSESAGVTLETNI